jgi:dethiobiotin synthetase
VEKAYFITGTDTNVGKTRATIALMHYFKNQGKAVIGMKPVAAGCVMQDGQLKNDDAVLMQAHSNVPVSYRSINPYAYELPVSPHIAGAGNPVCLDKVCAGFAGLAEQADVLLVEGAGGWYSPLSCSVDNRSLALALGLPVILVVAVKLGCINHALLTQEAIGNSGLSCAGWLAICIDPGMLCLMENIDSLQIRLNSPLLGIIPYSSVACYETMAKLISL